MEQKPNFIYTTGGKVLRGILCLLAFALGLICTIYTVQGIYSYGGASVLTTESNFFESEIYQDQVECGMSLALDRLKMKEEPAQDTVSLIDVSQKEQYTYNLAEMYDDYGDELYMNSDDISIFNEYRKEYKHIDNLDMSDYEKAREFLADKNYADDYIYFDEAAFQALFYDAGFRNTNCRFSYDFSEDAYFLFDYQGKNKTATKLLEKIRETDKEETVGEWYNLNNIDYAVYDGVDVYYSTSDDYFGEMGSYVYSVSEINNILNELDENGSRYDSILIALLKAENVAEYWITDPYFAYGNAHSAEKTLKENFDLNTTGLFYYIEQNGVKQCSDSALAKTLSDDADKAQQQVVDYLTDNNCIYYSFYLNYYQNEFAQESNNNTPIRYEDYAENELEDMNPNGSTRFIYGIYIGSKTMENNLVQISMNEYNFYKRYARFFLVGAVVAMLATIGLAVSLILTTGRRYKKDKEVALQRYDKLPGELWWLVTGLILLVTGICLGSIAAYVIPNLYTESTFFLCVCFGAVCAVIFAFFVMEMVLSFCRRIKGKDRKSVV